MRTACIVLGDGTERVAGRLAERLTSPAEEVTVLACRGKGGLRPLVESAFRSYDGLVFFMALGIVVRMIAPLLRGKHEDPAVVVVDDEARFAVSALSGHEGGANRLAFRVAAALDAVPVVTTGSDTRRKIIVGIGCRRGVDAEEVRRAILAALERAGIETDQVRLATTVDLKRNEKGLVDACAALDLPPLFVPSDEIARWSGGGSDSDVVRRHLGLKGVSEQCALIMGRRAELILEKTTFGRVTVALVREDSRSSGSAPVTTAT